MKTLVWRYIFRRRSEFMIEDIELDYFIAKFYSLRQAKRYLRKHRDRDLVIIEFPL